MTPTTDERLASIIRSLTEVILPHLPSDASLAQEQVHLAIGHLQILRSQIDAIPAFEQDELDDAIAIGRALVEGVSGGAATGAASEALNDAVFAADGNDTRGQATAINLAIDALVKAVSSDGEEGARHSLSSIILKHEARRVPKDRKWFLPYGFDTLEMPA
jgi:hypothetical protein